MEAEENKNKENNPDNLINNNLINKTNKAIDSNKIENSKIDNNNDKNYKKEGINVNGANSLDDFKDDLSNEDIEKNLDFYFGNKIGIIYNFGKDLYFEVSPKDLPEVIDVLKNNSSFNFDVLSYIKYKEHRNFLLIGLFSYERGLSINLRVKDFFNEKKLDLKNILSLTKKCFETAENFLEQSYLKDIYTDVVILSQVPETLDNFDMYLSLDAGSSSIKSLYLNDEISSFDLSILFRSSEINKLISILNTLDYKAAIFPELCFCIGMESLLSIKISKRTEYIRMLLCELFRVSCHLSYVINMSIVVGNLNIFNYALIEREKVLNLIEQITGSRIVPNFIRIGGVKKDLDNNVLSSIEKIIKPLYKSIKRIEDNFLSDVIILEKLKNICFLNSNVAKLFGVTGPNLRASGLRYDLRKTENYLLYRDFSFITPLGRYGDNLDRVIVRFKEIYQSLKIISEIVLSMPTGVVGNTLDIKNIELEASPIISSVECPHGVFKLFIEVGQNKEIEIIPIGPTKNNINAAEESLKGSDFEDLLPSVSSFGIESSEMY